jgi:hypothetical protein
MKISLIIFVFVFPEVTCKNIMCTRQQIFLYIQDKWGATLQELEILENKFSAIKVCRFFISQNSKDKLLQPLISKMKRNDSHRTLHVLTQKMQIGLNKTSLSKLVQVYFTFVISISI